MRLIAALILCVLPTWAAVAHVQSKSVSTAASTAAAALASNATAGNAIFVLVKWVEPSTPTFTSVADNNSNTYTCGSVVQGTGTITAKFIACYDLSVNAGATTIMSTLSSAPGYHCITVVEVSGQDTGSQPDVALTLAEANSGTGYTSAASVTTTVAGDLLLSQVISSGSTPPAGTGWTQIGGAGWEGDNYRAVTTAGAYPALRTDASSQAWNVTNYAIKASGGAAAPVMRRRVIVQ